MGHGALEDGLVIASSGPVSSSPVATHIASRDRVGCGALLYALPIDCFYICIRLSFEQAPGRNVASDATVPSAGAVSRQRLCQPLKGVSHEFQAR